MAGCNFEHLVHSISFTAPRSQHLVHSSSSEEKPTSAPPMPLSGELAPSSSRLAYPEPEVLPLAGVLAPDPYGERIESMRCWSHESVTARGERLRRSSE